MRKKTLNDKAELKRLSDARAQQEKTASIENEGQKKQPDPGQDQSPYFTDENGYLCRTKRTKDGSVNIRLANFDAHITESNLIDDGQETINLYSIEGHLSDKRILPKIEIPSHQFAGMTWIHKWGTGAIVEPGQTTKDFIRHRIHTASHSRGIKTRVHYAHTGWRKVDGKDVYLHAGGAIGGGDISIKLPKELQRYELPPIPHQDADSAKKTLGTCLTFLDIASRSVTVPIFSNIFLSPLTTVLTPMPNFSLYLYGSSGTFKSTLAVTALAFFGSFTGVETLSNLDDTIGNLEKRLFILKDSLAVVDDFHPAHRKMTAQDMEAKVQRLIRNQANRTGRGRLNTDLTEKARYEPRGMLLITGEELPGLESTLARVHVVEVTERAVDKKSLTDLQRNLPLLAMGMSHYVSWLRDNLPAIVKSFPGRFVDLRERAAGEGFHRRLPEQTAFLRFALELVASFMVDRKVMTDVEASALVDEGWSVFKDQAAQQQKRISDDDPVKLFTEILGILVAQGKVRIQHINEGEPIGAGNAIGFYDGACLFLYPTAVWHEVNSFLQKESGYFPFSRNTFTQMLRNRKIIQPSPTGDNTSFIKVKGKSHRVIKIIDHFVYKSVTSVTIDQESQVTEDV